MGVYKRGRGVELVSTEKQHQLSGQMRKWIGDFRISSQTPYQLGYGASDHGVPVPTYAIIQFSFSFFFFFFSFFSLFFILSHKEKDQLLRVFVSSNQNNPNKVVELNEMDVRRSSNKQQF